jgi:uncharacterized integral membrane protein
MEKKKEFNRIIISIFLFVAVALLIVAAFNNVPVDLFSLKFSLGLLLYPFIAIEAALIGFIAMTAFKQPHSQEAPKA